MGPASHRACSVHCASSDLLEFCNRLGQKDNATAHKLKCKSTTTQTQLCGMDSLQVHGTPKEIWDPSNRWMRQSWTVHAISVHQVSRAS